MGNSSAITARISRYAAFYRHLRGYILADGRTPYTKVHKNLRFQTSWNSDFCDFVHG